MNKVKMIMLGLLLNVIIFGLAGSGGAANTEDNSLLYSGTQHIDTYRVQQDEDVSTMISSGILAEDESGQDNYSSDDAIDIFKILGFIWSTFWGALVTATGFSGTQTSLTEELASLIVVGIIITSNAMIIFGLWSLWKSGSDE